MHVYVVVVFDMCVCRYCAVGFNLDGISRSVVRLYESSLDGAMTSKINTILRVY